MKKFVSCAVALSLLAASTYAVADTVLTGTITSERTEVVYAPYGGQIANVRVFEGDLVNIGDPIVDIEPTPIYAPMAGTIVAIFGQTGDSAESIEERYGAVMYLESNSRYTISANTERSYSSSAAKTIHMGEVVFITCNADGSHMGKGIISAIGDTDEEGNTAYTVEVNSGTLFIGESVKICRSSDYSAESCIGRGTVAQAKPVTIKGAGSILSLAVKPGDVVDRGELLFETVEGNLDGLYAVDNHIVAPVSGIVAKAELEEGGSVSQKGVLISVYPQESLQAQVEIPVMDLSNYSVGMPVTIEIDIGGYDMLRYAGSIARISHAVNGDENARTKTVKAWIDFDADASVLYGMPVNVYMAAGTQSAD